ncbi:Serpine2 [Scenedesmus sp. PABB004]|nr:Serpine2 [Scenedesmus sp. PABB004]
MEAPAAQAGSFDGADSSGAFEPESLRRLVRAFLSAFDRSSENDDLPSVEEAGTLLWDLTADPEAAAFLAAEQLPTALGLTLAVAAGQHPAADPRVTEMALGMLANFYAAGQPARAQLLGPSLQRQQSAVPMLLASLDDPPALSELCRLVAAVLGTPEGRTAWLPVLLGDFVLERLLAIIDNTLHPLLLQRSLEAVAALLHAERAARMEQQPAPEEQQERRPLLERLLALGLAESLLGVLGPATSGAPSRRGAGGGGWDDDDDDEDGSDGAGGAASPSGALGPSDHRQLYRDAAVLEALLGLLQELGTEPDDAALLAASAPSLPELLLELLSALRGQQLLLELLLPVLVLFRAAIVPLLQQEDPPDGEQPDAAARPGAGERRGPLARVAAVAVATQDCAADSLDCLDACWFLCASALQRLWRAEPQRCAARGEHEADARQHSAAVAAATAACGELVSVGGCLWRAQLPDSAAGYAGRAAGGVVGALAALGERLVWGEGAAGRGDAASARERAALARSMQRVASTLEPLLQRLAPDVPAAQLHRQLCEALREVPDAVCTMSDAAVAFGAALYRELLKSGALAGLPAGAFVSPLSVWLALVIVLNGAGPLSSTQQQLWAALAPPSGGGPPANLTAGGWAAAEASLNARAAALVAGLLQSPGTANGTELGIANGVWTRRLAVNKAFGERMWATFKTPVKAVNDTTPINAWAAAKTGGRITQAVPPGTEFNLIVTNAVYFKSSWVYAFDPDTTSKRPFSVAGPGGKAATVAVDMMYRRFEPRDINAGGNVAYAEAAGQYRAVKLPYRGTGVVAIAVLPDEAKYGLNADAAAAGIGLGPLLNGSAWRSVAALGSLTLQLPRFKVRAEQLPLGAALRALGVTAAFDPDAANFSRMSPEALFITSVVQSSVVLVDERGTEAAAVTSVVMTTTSFVEPSTPPLVFNRPFLFVLVDEPSGAVLFQVGMVLAGAAGRRGAARARRGAAARPALTAAPGPGRAAQGTVKDPSKAVP